MLGPLSPTLPAQRFSVVVDSTDYIVNATPGYKKHGRIGSVGLHPRCAKLTGPNGTYLALTKQRTMESFEKAAVRIFCPVMVLVKWGHCVIRNVDYYAYQFRRQIHLSRSTTARRAMARLPPPASDSDSSSDDEDESIPNSPDVLRPTRYDTATDSETESVDV